MAAHPASGIFSLKKPVTDESLRQKKLRDLAFERNKRHANIDTEITSGIKSARTTSKWRSNHVEQPPHETVHIHHWENERSVTYIDTYLKLKKALDLTDAELASEIKGDIDYFEKRLRELQVQFREWKIEPRYADAAKTRPNLILVSRNK